MDREVADEVERLENETDLAVADARALARDSPCTGRVLSRYSPSARGVEEPEIERSVELAATRRSGDRDVFALEDLKMNAGERVGLELRRSGRPS